MLKMVRQQMICIIAPGWPGTVDFSKSGRRVPRAGGSLWECRGGSVRFDRAVAGKGGFAGPAAVIDARARYRGRHRSARHAVPAHQSSERCDVVALQLVLARRWSCPRERAQRAIVRQADGVAQHRRGRLRRRPRPNARQIQKEQELLQWTRSEARALKATKQYGADRTSFALALARRACQDPRFEWALEPAPRSYWRGSGESISAKVGLVLVVFGLWVAAVWLVGAVPRWLTGGCAWFFGLSHRPLQAFTDVVGKASDWVLGVSIRGVVALIVLGLLCVVVPGRAAGTARALAALAGQYLSRARTADADVVITGNLCGRLYRHLAACTWPLAACALVYTFCLTYLAAKIKEWIPDVPGWKLIVIAAVAIVVLLFVGALLSRIVGALFSWINRRFPDLSDAFFHPHEDDVPRAQQVHPSIDSAKRSWPTGTKSHTWSA